MSSHNVKCLENVDVFSLEADDLESITKNFYKHMSKPRVQGVLRFLFCSDWHFYLASQGEKVRANQVQVLETYGWNG